jgi:heavy metal sensor kinase
MTLRARITLWHTAVLVVSLAVMAGVFHYEMQEQRQAMRAGLKPPDPILEETGEFVLYFGLPTALLLLVGSAWFIRRSLTPVARLTAAAERIQLNQLQERLPRSGKGDELDRLTEVFNTMTARLHESFGHMREFTLHASHELKTPLTVMRGELEIALRDSRCAGEQREMLAGLLDEVHRLTKIVDGLAFLAKADAGQAVLKLEPVRLDELVRDSLADAQMLARDQKITVTLAGCDEVLVQGDRYRLRQLLLNLTDNAIKYNQPEGRVNIALTRNADSAVLQVGNTGPGIPPEKLPRVFDRFFRGDPAHNNDVEGCGLGLSIAQWIVQAHGGEIHLASEPDKLTTVSVRMPIQITGESGVTSPKEQSDPNHAKSTKSS